MFVENPLALNYNFVGLSVCLHSVQTSRLSHLWLKRCCDVKIHQKSLDDPWWVNAQKPAAKEADETWQQPSENRTRSNQRTFCVWSDLHDSPLFYLTAQHAAACNKWCRDITSTTPLDSINSRELLQLAEKLNTNRAMMPHKKSLCFVTASLLCLFTLTI